MGGKQERARSGAYPIGCHDEVGIQLARRGDHARCRSPGLPCLSARPARCHLDSQGEHPAGQAGRQRVDDGRPRQQDDRVPEPVQDHPAGRAAHKPPAVGPADAHFLRNCQAPEPAPCTDRIECPQPVGSQRQGSPDGSSDAARSHTVTCQPGAPCCRRQTVDTRTDHNRTRSCHHGAPLGSIHLPQPVV